MFIKKDLFRVEESIFDYKSFILSWKKVPGLIKRIAFEMKKVFLLEKVSFSNQKKFHV